MKTIACKFALLALLPASLLALTSCTSTSTPPPAAGSAKLEYAKGVPGGVIVQTFETAATVTAIDPANRTATLLVSGGRKFIVKLGPEVANVDQVRVGDQVNATVVQKIAAALEPEGTASGDVSAAVVAQAPKADLVAEATEVTARVTAIDPIKRTATLQFADGTTRIQPIRDDVDLSRFKVGEHAVFRVTEMIAIRIGKR